MKRTGRNHEGLNRKVGLKINEQKGKYIVMGGTGSGKNIEFKNNKVKSNKVRPQHEVRI